MASPSIAFLRSVDLFSEVSERGLREIGESMSRRAFSAGDVVVGEGDGGIGFFLIESGTVGISKGGQNIVRLGPGSHLGATALIARTERTATVTAESDVVCWAMTAWVFRPMLKSQPTVTLKLLEDLARQLAD